LNQFLGQGLRIIAKEYFFPWERFALHIVDNMHVIIFILFVHLINAGEVFPFIGLEQINERLLDSDFPLILFYYFGMAAFLHYVKYRFLIPIQIFHSAYGFFLWGTDCIYYIKRVHVILLVDMKLHVLYRCKYVQITQSYLLWRTLIMLSFYTLLTPQ
jgi:hypothetical protein